MAPARYDTEAEQVNAGRAVCLQHGDGKADGEIVESMVSWAGAAPGPGGVSREEAARFIPYALQHCGYLLGGDAAGVIEQGR